MILTKIEKFLYSFYTLKYYLMNFTDKELEYLEFVLSQNFDSYSKSIREKIRLHTFYNKKHENYFLSNRNEFPPLHTAIKNKDYNKVFRLIKYTDINVTTGNGFSPLHVAARFNYFEIIDLLIENGADVNLKNAFGWTPLMVACEHDNLKCVRKLCKVSNLDINHQSSVGNWSALMRATMSKNKTYNYINENLNYKSNQKNIIEILVNMGANIFSENSYYQSAMTIGLESDNYQVRMLYIEYQKFNNNSKMSNKECKDFNNIFYEKLLDEN